jgi:hypothetical protein
MMLRLAKRVSVASLEIHVIALKRVMIIPHLCGVADASVDCWFKEGVDVDKVYISETHW